MDFPVFLNKWIISNRFLHYTPFWWWYRLMCHEGFRFDDYYLWRSFWESLNGGYIDMNHKWAFEQFWGKGAKTETILLPKEDFDALVERLNSPPDPEVTERLRKLMNRPLPWEDSP